MLGETLERIGTHSRATTTYLIMLAMEKHEEGSDIKAR
jgi:hypothetical protein